MNEGVKGEKRVSEGEMVTNIKDVTTNMSTRMTFTPNER